MIRPVGFSSTGIQVMHDERAHGGTVPWSAIVLDWPSRALYLTCPASCGSVSRYPVGGGGAPGPGQRLFIHLVKRAQAGRTWLQARAIVKTAVRQLEGDGRWQLDTAEEDV
jgi:hypothetical protein